MVFEVVFLTRDGCVMRVHREAASAEEARLLLSGQGLNVCRVREVRWAETVDAAELEAWN